MYSFVAEDGQLSINWMNRSFLKNIKPLACFDDSDDPVYLVLKDESTDEQEGERDCTGNGCTEDRWWRFRYTSDTGVIDLSLEFNVLGNIMFMRVSAQCMKSRFTFARGTFFKPDCALKINIESIGDVDGYAGSHRNSEFWTKPYYGRQISDLPKDIQALLWKGYGAYHYMLPVCDDEYKCILCGSKQGMDMVLYTGASGYDNCDTLACVFGIDKDPFILPYATTEAGIKNIRTPGRLRTERKYPELFEYLGWCSWDAFQLWVNSEGVLGKAQEFKEKKLPVKWFIIDDMWVEVRNNDDLKTTHDNSLWSFEADPDRFPGGLEPMIRKLKDEYGIKTGVWHPITGYWTGIDQEGPVAQKYSHLLDKTPSGRLIPPSDVPRGFMFWNAWHSLLKKQGVEFVKVDNQSFIRGFYRNKLPVCTIAKQMHEALEASTGLNFNNNMINCMGMASENVWHRPWSAISRSSNDFLPDDPKSFNDHALANAFNSYVYGPFIWCDWDMWWSNDSQGRKSSILRAVSGGPVYLSDKLGETRGLVVWPLIFSNGRVIRCDRPGCPTEDCLIEDPRESGKPFKIWNTSGEAGIIAAFNVNGTGSPVSGKVSAADVPGFDAERYVIYEYFSGFAKKMDTTTEIKFRLKPDDVALFILTPIRSDFTPIGLINKYICPGTIKCSIDGASSHIVILEDKGIFGFYSDRKPENVYVNGKESSCVYRNDLYLIDCSDCEKEVVVEVFL